MTAQLFDPKTTLSPRCSWCGATRPGDCRHAQIVAEGIITSSSTKPRSCLTRHDPTTARIPF